MSVNHARQEFGRLVAVNGVSFGWKAGEVFGLIGPNGTGKSTTFHLVTGVLQPTRGEITLSWAVHRSARFAQYRQARHRSYISVNEMYDHDSARECRERCAFAWNDRRISQHHLH
ncbi:Branched-chain amino acid transport system permease protein livM / Branched-chain amino acid transport ATP-binding protein livG [Mycetohabitans rhizoxinica HKI 454]|uniref:Branched-chain amino acid transport system permease protein livM / Branched-chain amino acid transport ATP-binding protein livG n=1 Tax=Mycetohabitans rhizoxinica (strain DSM 19002 / CIP 109453 / HKI 454) TaxID=882378 RepID=E5AKI7_MYCRK|nr:Branched-chain amino acid transport system permease protein livM / Branched-chain amino acid transport ATP-binding protein livG [Mycetohabitans rhizoxinica HKI 454]